MINKLCKFVQFYLVAKGLGDEHDSRARARGVTASFSINGISLANDEPPDLYRENEELKVCPFTRLFHFHPVAAFRMAVFCTRLIRRLLFVFSLPDIFGSEIFFKRIFRPRLPNCSLSRKRTRTDQVQCSIKLCKKKNLFHLMNKLTVSIVHLSVLSTLNPQFSFCCHSNANRLLHERNGRSDAIGARFRFPELLITYDRLPWLPVLFDFDWSDWFVLC